MARKNNPQTIYVKLSCGHIEGILTSLYRVHKSTHSCIIGAAVRKGVWCNACGGTEQVVGNADKPRPIWRDPSHPDHEEMQQGLYENMADNEQIPSSDAIKVELIEAARAAIAKAKGDK